MSEVLCNWNSPVEHITYESYCDWLKTSKVIEGHQAMFTSCCGPHEFSMLIEKNGILYELFDGWYPEAETDPNSQYKSKTTYWWGIRELHLQPNQNGDGI